MPLALFQTHTELNGLPDVSKIDTVYTAIGDLPTTPDGLRKMQSQLVRFDDVFFQDADGVATYAAYQVSTDRYIQDAAGNTLNVRTSGYADFWSEKLPTGTGSIVGILSYYGTGWQLWLRSIVVEVVFAD